LVALAGFAGAVAAGGWAKRVVGGIVVLAGLLAGWAALAGGSGPGPVLSLVGAAALVVAGFLVIRFAARLPTLGAKYRSAGARRASGDPAKDLWDGLSQGQDPTVGHPADNAAKNVRDER
ncbi:MAG: Trp biosynthesis-associated membrane protein, partial [Actinophytocola sp.]|uniref:Trp biosynthesis-associated membrane protein n=1 Tax=Actinophytocola sp. TaxID=1872138 RepID=UPI003D6BD1A4